MQWNVTVKAFGRILSDNVDAPTREEAERIVLDRIGFALTTKETGFAIYEGERIPLK